MIMSGPSGSFSVRRSNIGSMNVAFMFTGRAPAPYRGYPPRLRFESHRMASGEANPYPRHDVILSLSQSPRTYTFRVILATCFALASCMGGPILRWLTSLTMEETMPQDSTARADEGDEQSAVSSTIGVRTPPCRNS